MSIVLTIRWLIKKNRCTRVKENSYLKKSTYVDLNKRLIQIKLQISLQTCAPRTELPFNN